MNPEQKTDRRIGGLARRVTNVEEAVEAHENTLYELRRQAARDDLRWERLFEHLNIADVTDAEVEAELERDA